MVSDYSFYNSNYDIIERDIKASSFDLISQAESVLSEDEKIAIAENDPERKNKLRQLCTQERNHIKDAVNITNQLVIALRKIDSDLKNRNIFYNQENSIENQNMVEASSEKDEEVSETVPETPAVEVDENVAAEVTDGEAQNEVVSEAPVAPVEDAVAAVENALTTETTNGEVHNEVVSETPAAPVEDAVAAVENALTTETTDGEVQNEVVSETPAAPVEDAVAAVENAVTTETTDGEVQNEVVSETPAAPVEDALTTETTNGEVQNEVVSETPAAPVEDAVAAVKNALTTEATDGEVQNEVVSETPVAPVEGSAIELPVISQENDNLKRELFIKKDTLASKAIITTAKQTEKLKSSYELQKDLFHNFSNHYTPLDGSTEAVSLKNENVAISPIAGDQPTEQVLVNNGLLEPTLEDKQKQIEEMTNQATALYKEGKADEAQAILEKVTMLNQELKEGNSNNNSITA